MDIMLANQTLAKFASRC